MILQVYFIYLPALLQSWNLLVSMILFLIQSALEPLTTAVNPRQCLPSMICLSYADWSIEQDELTIRMGIHQWDMRGDNLKLGRISVIVPALCLRDPKRYWDHGLAAGPRCPKISVWVCCSWFSLNNFELILSCKFCLHFIFCNAILPGYLSSEKVVADAVDHFVFIMPSIWGSWKSKFCRLLCS